MRDNTQDGFYNAGMRVFDIYMYMYLDEVHEIPELRGVIGWEKIQSLPEDAVIKWPIRRASINNNNTEQVVLKGLGLPFFGAAEICIRGIL